MSDKTGSGGVGFIGLLTLLFIGLKLTGYIAWSWVWVLAPVWVPFIFICVLITLAIAMAGSNKLK